MKKIIILLSVILLACGTSYAQKIKNMKFRDNGTLKIIQFTDTHLNPSDEYRKNEANKTFARINKVVSIEKPDLLVFTGDVVTGKPAAQMWNRLIETLNKLKTPFCIVFGNHDPEQDLTNAQMADIIVSSEYSLNKKDSQGRLADMEIPILHHNSHEAALALYCMDSHDNSTIPGIEGYGWFTTEQVSWLRDKCNAMTASKGGKHLPSLAFFHIVLPEYLPAWRNKKNTHIGRAGEDECPGALNTGMHAAMVETGNVFGIFVGHDHDIDYIVADKGLALGYGRYSGDDTTYNNLRPGARILIVSEGKREFETYIREDDGRIVDHVRFKDGEISKVRK